VHAARFAEAVGVLLHHGQVWDFLDVAVDKPRRAMAACVAMIEKLKPVKSDSSECLRKRYEELRTIGEQAKMEGVYSYLLTKAVAEKILSGLPPTEKEAMRAKSSKPATGPPVDSLQSPEMLWEYVWRWQPPQPPAARPGAAKATASVKRGAKKCLVEGCKGAPTNWWSARSFSVWAPSTGTCTA
jgi:hypothetical protein